ncbi:ScbR family autoregulator-binding transcription factor [Streptomyces cavernicola]|uniref:ScbR family autoregulator-binding transcription factor n=1 Tax=Streptomyces cavernicola TaxID=3043613 RepID=A0ABT6S5F8_9ACTN|nr:ScbR family autoregulator-binding transcription factor [Streptomyces sp. B-S-A6]MDI3403260.1 ScbR family autoregulator-binding transcription factor [Streptomyces sp. B-S-A6]
MRALKQDRAEQTRQRLLRAAAEVFDELGYAGTSVTKIVQRAGVTPGAMYFHFKSKDDLARAVIRAMPDTVLPLTEGSGLQHLVDVILVWSQQLQHNPMMRAGVRLVVEQSAFGQSDASSFRDWERILTESLVKAQELGQLRDSVVPEEVAQLVLGATTGIQQYSLIASGRQDLPQRVESLFRILVSGIAPEEVADMIDASVERGIRLYEAGPQ